MVNAKSFTAAGFLGKRSVITTTCFLSSKAAETLHTLEMELIRRA